MARIRSIHPDICEDEVVAGLSDHAYRTWTMMWTHLDDEGRGVDSAKLWKSRLYPLLDRKTAERVEDDLAELQASKLLQRYEVDGKRYLCTKPAAWKRWQRPQKPSPSKLPPPPVTEEYATGPVGLSHGVEWSGGKGRGDGEGGEGESEGEGSGATHLERALRAMALQDTAASRLLNQAEALAHDLAQEEHQQVLADMKSRRNGQRKARA